METIYKPFQNQASDGSSILGNQGSTLDSNNNDAFRKLSAIRKLQSGWDTYDGEPPTPESCNVVQAILNASQDYALSVTYVTPTSDGSILLKHEIGGTSVTWEVDGDGEIGMMIERRNNAPIFRSLIDTRIESFIAGLVWNV